MSSTNSKSWSITNAHGDTTLMFYKRSDDPEYISVFMIAPSAIKTLHVGAALGVCDYDFENNGMPHRVHMDFARAVWNGLTEKVGWRSVVAVA
jgi:hypothetical protein